MKSNTTWVEDKFSVWRHPATGAAIGFALPNSKRGPPGDAGLGFAPEPAAKNSFESQQSMIDSNQPKINGNGHDRKSFLIAWGNPLCEGRQLKEVVSTFLKWCEREGFSPIWCCVSDPTERVLAEELGWRAVCCIQEDVLDPRRAEPEKNKEVRRHIRGAQRAGCRIIEEDGVPNEKVRREIDKLIQEWKTSRKGTQVHTTNVEPWRDTEHRKYFYSRDADGKVKYQKTFPLYIGLPDFKVIGFLFLAKVGNGWAIKDSIASKFSPKNLTEWLIASAIQSLANDGESRLTFGPTPAESLTSADNSQISTGTVKFLNKTYSGIEHAVLGNKREFRRKFSTEGEPIFVCFPPHGLGRHGISALMKVLTE